MSETSGRNSAEKCGVDKMEPATGNSKADASTPRVVTLSQDMRLARENVDSENLENTTAGPKRSFRMRLDIDVTVFASGLDICTES